MFLVLQLVLKVLVTRVFLVDQDLLLDLNRQSHVELQFVEHHPKVSKESQFFTFTYFAFFFFGPFFFSTNYNHSVHFYMTKKLKVSLLKEIVILSKRMENRNFVVGDNVICIIVSLVSFFRDYCSNWTVWVFSGCSHL